MSSAAATYEGGQALPEPPETAGGDSPMGRSAAPELTVRYSGSAHTFVAGNDVVIGRDIHADLRIPDPLISRAHLVLRFDEGRWVAIDNDSLNGMFVEGRRVPAVDVEDGQNVNIGSLVGPLLVFEVDGNSVGGASSSEVSSVPPPASAQPTDVGPAPRRNSGERSNLATSIRKIHLPGRSAEAPSGSLTIGRSTDNDIVITDMLASRHHATLVPTAAGTEIHDAHSINGTFVNGAPVDQALLHEGDLVTIGNVDLVFENGTLARRSETEAATRTGGLGVHGVTWTIEGNKTLLDNISLTALPGTLTAVIGPSGAGKSSLARLIAGYTQPTDGAVTFEGHDIHADYASLRSRIGMVPQDDVLHHQLTVNQALGYAAELRLPPDTSKQERRQVVAQVLEELEVTHSLSYLDVCDQVLLLTPGGKTAFCGPPSQIGLSMGTTNWADIFSAIGTDPEAAHLRFLERVKPPPAPRDSEKPANLGGPTHTSLWRQFSTIARRQVRLIAADRGYFVFLAVLPFVLGVLTLLVPGNGGLGFHDPRGHAADEPVQIVFMLSVSAVFLGTALTIRDLVGERGIFRREQAAGLSASAYLAAKITVFTVAAAAQIAVVTAIVVIGKSSPTRGAVILGNPTLELYVTLALTAAVAAIMGLALSAAATSQDQILPMLVITMMLSIVFGGGMIPVTGRIPLDQMSWLLPARWGFAATASTVDLTTVAPVLQTNDRLWSHASNWWLLDMTMLAVLGLVMAGFVRWRVRLR